jgi:hypothetical protein
VASDFAHGIPTFYFLFGACCIFVGYALVDFGWRCLPFRITALILRYREAQDGKESGGWEWKGTGTRETLREVVLVKYRGRSFEITPWQLKCRLFDELMMICCFFESGLFPRCRGKGGQDGFHEYLFIVVHKLGWGWMGMLARRRKTCREGTIRCIFTLGERRKKKGLRCLRFRSEVALS